MRQKMRIIGYGLLLTVFWLIPLVSHSVTFDTDFVKIIVSYGLFAVAAYLCFLLPNRHAALIVAVMLGAGMCFVSSIAVYDILPALLLCCWLRCYSEREKGSSVSVYFELFTDLIYAYLVAAVVRLVRYGYIPADFRNMDIQSMADLCLSVVVLCVFLILFIGGYGKASPSSVDKKNRKSTTRSGRRIVGVMPVYISLRTFWGFCVVLLAASLLQFVNGNLVTENSVFFRTGFRFLFFPWMMLLFFALDEILSRNTAIKRYLPDKCL